jgi:hypothetical protein
MPFLDWINKNEAIQVAKNVPYHLIKKEKKYGEETENLLIQGDNLLALKALKPFFANKIKCVFIDPPYNTQSAFTHYDDKLEHSQWLSMMYPRVVLLRELLAENGSIWVSLDDNEAHYFKVLMDEIFGRANFVANVVEFEIMSKDDDEIALFDRIDIIFTTFFTVEFIANMIAHIDFVPFPFLSSGWNVLDLVVVLVSLFSAASKAFLETEKNGNSKALQDQNQSLKVLRILRAFRVVRVFKRLTALRLIIVALGASILPVLNTFFVLFVATAVRRKSPTPKIDRV